MLTFVRRSTMLLLTLKSNNKLEIEQTNFNWLTIMYLLHLICFAGDPHTHNTQTHTHARKHTSHDARFETLSGFN